jgi:pimeloyl-ACP methyl ester carboxylesterase
MAPSTVRVRIRARWQNPSVRAALTSVAALALLGLQATGASASTPFRPCKGTPRVQCARVDVPLDRSGAIPGTISLNVERLAARDTRQGAVFALAGGPGQAAAPLLLDFATSIERALRSRDLIAYDQRGTGKSGLLRCPSLEKPSVGDAGTAVQACAAALGPRRAFYTTSDSVEDMEAVRRVIGVERITIYGTSYGTKLALAYAARYPAHVERLVLDSILPLDGPDPFTRDIIGAVPRVLRTLCANDACQGIAADPVGDLAALVRRLQTSPIRGPVVGGDGRRRMRRLGRLRLLRILVDGDLDPSLRAEFPAAVRSALRGDSAPLLRLAHRAALGEEDNEPPKDFSPALFVATSCEDGPLPWQPSAPLLDRWAQAISKAGSLPDSAFYPFDRATGRASDTLRLCAHWPVAGSQPPPAGALPNVPTLILSGGDDLRTPLEGAMRVAAQIPKATRLVLPGTGHSALLNDLSLCASHAVRLFFEDRPVSATCPRLGQEIRELLSTFFLPTPVAPASLSRIPPAFRISGRAGRTLGAFEQTLADAFVEELWAKLLIDVSAPHPIGGLRAGRMRADGSLDRYSYVPGVEVTSLGRRKKRSGGGLLQIPRIERFRVGGERAAHGVLILDNKKLTIAGQLGGRHLRIDLRRELKRLLREGEKSSAHLGVVDRCCQLIR